MSQFENQKTLEHKRKAYVESLKSVRLVSNGFAFDRSMRKSIFEDGLVGGIIGGILYSVPAQKRTGIIS